MENKTGTKDETCMNMFSFLSAAVQANMVRIRSTTGFHGSRNAMRRYSPPKPALVAFHSMGRSGSLSCNEMLNWVLRSFGLISLVSLEIADWLRLISKVGMFSLSELSTNNLREIGLSSTRKGRSSSSRKQIICEAVHSSSYSGMSKGVDVSTWALRLSQAWVVI